MPSFDREQTASGGRRQMTRPPVVAAGEDIWAPDLGRRAVLWPCVPSGLDRDTAEMLRDWETAQGRRSR
jgi:hypothetical protein